MVPIREFCASLTNTSTKALPVSKLKGITFADFDYLYWEEQKRRDAQKKLDKQNLMISLLSTPKGRQLVRENGWDAVEKPFLDLELEKEFEQESGVNSNSENTDSNNNNISGGDKSAANGESGSGYYDDFGDDGFNFDDDDDNHNFSYSPSSNHAAETNSGDHSLPTTSLSPRSKSLLSSGEVEEPIPVTQSYEELVREHIDKFLTSAQLYAQETMLSKRVSEWESKIRPVLEEQVR